jgi:titin
MNKMLLTSQWLIAAAACVLLCTLLVGGSVWAQTATLPSAPAIASLTPSDQAITVVWTAPASNGGSDITSYDLRYIRSDATDKADDSWTVREDIWSSGLLQYGLNESTGFNLSGGVRYDVQVRAVNDAWTVREDIWSSGLLQYGLNESTGFNLSGGVRYDVQVRAVNAVGNGSWSASETGTPRSPSQPVTVPGAPASLLVTPGDGSLSIAWSAPADDGGADVTSYDLRYILSDVQDRSDASWTVEEDVWSSGALEYTLSSLTNGASYDVQVRAVNEAGNGPWSASETGTPSVHCLVGAGRRRRGGRHVSGALEYTLSSLTNGASYDVQVRAVNEAGNGPWSASETGTPSNRSPHPVRPRPSW